MCGAAPAARPSCGGVPRRAAPVRPDAAAGSLALGPKEPRRAAPAARGVMMARDSTACRAGAGGFHVNKKQIVDCVEVEAEVTPVGRGKPVDPAPGHLRGVLARDPSVCLAAVEVFAVPRGKRTKRTRNNVDAGAEASTVSGETPVDPALDLLHKRMASELEALRELVKKAELTSQGPACKSGAATAGKSKRILAAEPRSEAQIEAGGKMQSVKRRKMSPPLDQNQKQIEVPRMSAHEREQLAGRLASLAAVPGHIVEFLQQQFGGDADPQGEIEIDVHKVEDSVLFELKTRLDKFAEERLSADAAVLPEEEHAPVMMELDPKTQMDSNLAEVIRSDAIPEQDEEDVDICAIESDSDEVVSIPAPPAVLLPEENGTSAQPPPAPAPEAEQSTEPEIVPDGVDSTTPPALLPEENVVIRAQPPSRPAPEDARSAEQKKVRGVQRAAPKAVCLPGVIFRAKVRRELMEIERAVQPDQSIHPRDLRRLCIAEYGRPGIMRQLGLLLKADA
ncbi:histone-lysine N-methyltransferase SETD1A-like [Panicum miliaceum]|uniref:Histone-lysine N-methyltransferase SETD1A-like n=1 Tax=Panicum miliaceum TaxID=4540 RepID=A0A3L6QK37_PANMI|nr:histone-lysine N-methyltransferase SETD1A-like [Panicum miliaceum]